MNTYPEIPSNEYLLEVALERLKAKNKALKKKYRRACDERDSALAHLAVLESLEPGPVPPPDDDSWLVMEIIEKPEKPSGQDSKVPSVQKYLGSRPPAR